MTNKQKKVRDWIILLSMMFLLGIGYLSKDPVPEVNANPPINTPIIDQPPLPTPEDFVPLVWKGFHPEVLAWEPEIVQWSRMFNVDPNHTALIMQIESCGNPDAESWAGAAGLFQVMPLHFVDGESYSDMFDPDQNAAKALSYLVALNEWSGGDLPSAFAGYNAGPWVIYNDREYWPSETLWYVYWVEGILPDIYANNETSERLNEWYAMGGNSLCDDARKVRVDNTASVR